jgi:hypothetical protein
MNLTVGPLPPAVYWRRRVIVAGALLLLIILIVYSCGGSGKPAATGQGATANGSNRPSPTPSVAHLPPVIGSSPGAVSSGSGSSAGSISAPPSTPASDVCSDTEIQLTTGFQPITGGNAPYQLILKIKNISGRTCKRDVGADPQELHIVQNGQTMWSSDYCQTEHGKPDVRTFGPSIEASFTIGWDGSIGPKCTNQTFASGSLQVVGKLDTKVSPAVNFTINGNK